jgi:hypothetical protein
MFSSCRGFQHAYDTIQSGDTLAGGLIDGGASKLIMETETLRELIPTIYKPLEQYVEVSTVTHGSSVSGVGGKAWKIIGKTKLTFSLSLPFKIQSIDFEFIGEDGSVIPGLVHLHVLITLKATTYHDILPYGNGIMVVHETEKDGKTHVGFVHLYHKKSDHYMMPLGAFSKPTEQIHLRRIVPKYSKGLYQDCRKSSTSSRGAGHLALLIQCEESSDEEPHGVSASVEAPTVLHSACACSSVMNVDNGVESNLEEPRDYRLFSSINMDKSRDSMVASLHESIPSLFELSLRRERNFDT